MTGGKHARGAGGAQNARALPTAPRRWSDDPWSALTTGEGEAWRRGWEAARAQAVRAARQAPIPEDASPAEAYGRMAGTVEAAQAIEAMEPPA